MHEAEGFGGAALGDEAGEIGAERYDEGGDGEGLAGHAGVPGHARAPAGAGRGRVGRVGGAGVWRRAG